MAKHSKKRSVRDARKQRSSRAFVIALVAIAIVGVASLAYLTNRPKPVAQVIDTTGALPDARGHVMGDSAAPVEIVMFGDFECPGCGQFAVVTEPDVRTKIVQAGLARFRFMDFPLSGHQNTLVAHNAAACAGAQNKFWEMHDRIYHEQPNWSALAGGPESRNPEKAMASYARSLGLDGSAFDRCMSAHTMQPEIFATVRQGERLGVRGTPTFLIGARILPSNIPTYDQLKALVDSAIADGRRTPR